MLFTVYPNIIVLFIMLKLQVIAVSHLVVVSINYTIGYFLFVFYEDDENLLLEHLLKIISYHLYITNHLS